MNWDQDTENGISLKWSIDYLRLKFYGYKLLWNESDITQTQLRVRRTGVSESKV